jgi:hypothetical protein
VRYREEGKIARHALDDAHVASRLDRGVRHADARRAGR